MKTSHVAQIIIAGRQHAGAILGSPLRRTGLREAARRLCGSGCLLLTIIAPLSAQSLAAGPPPAS
jgi:hypothetical protein